MIHVMEQHELRSALANATITVVEMATGIPSTTLYGIKNGRAEDVKLDTAKRLTEHFTSGDVVRRVNVTTPPTRQEARDTGARYYFTGEPCLHGHLAARYTSSGQCVWCALKRGKQR